MLGEILDYMDDPVLQQLARSAPQANAKGVGVLPAGVGYQDMGGRVMRYRARGIEKTEPGMQRDIALTRRWMDAIGIDVAVMFPDADAAARPASAGRSRGGAGARL